MDTYQKSMNEKLRLHYGRDLDSHPRFRLVFTDNLTEKRKDSNGNVILLPKYSYIEGRWMLEVHANAVPNNPELITWDHYEPLWLYTVNQGEYYQPKWEDLAYIISRFIEQIVKPIKKNAAILETLETENMEKEINKIFDQLQQDHTFLEQQLKEGEAISFAGSKRFTDE